jgi:periplasmic divalent cation tolerance protein
MVSLYRWQGKLERDTERQMVIKTTRDRVPALEARLTQLHAYELPEFLVLSVDDASLAYVKWVKTDE